MLLILIGISLADRGGIRHHKPTPTPAPTPTPIPIPSVTLTWDSNPITGNPDTDAAGYFFRYGFSSGGETAKVNVGNVTVWTLQLTSGTTYYFVVSAYNQAGVESPPSNEVSYKAP